MSTITKLDPTVRTARADRRAVVRSLERALPFIPAGRVGVAMQAHAILDGVRRGPARTGEAKTRIFAGLMRQLMPAGGA